MEGGQRKLTFDQMKAATDEMETEIEAVEAALSKLNTDVLGVFEDGWNSDNAQRVKEGIDQMSSALEKVKNNTRRIRERIDTHITTVTATDVVNSGE